MGGGGRCYLPWAAPASTPSILPQGEEMGRRGFWQTQAGWPLLTQTGQEGAVPVLPSPLLSTSPPPPLSSLSLFPFVAMSQPASLPPSLLCSLSHSCLSASAVGCPTRPCTGEPVPPSPSKEEPVLYTAQAALPAEAHTSLSVSVRLHVPSLRARPACCHVLPCLRFLPGPSTSSRLRGTAPCTTLSCSTGSPRTERRST